MLIVVILFWPLIALALSCFLYGLLSKKGGQERLKAFLMLDIGLSILGYALVVGSLSGFENIDCGSCPYHYNFDLFLRGMLIWPFLTTIIGIPIMYLGVFFRSRFSSK